MPTTITIEYLKSVRKKLLVVNDLEQHPDPEVCRLFTRAVKGIDDLIGKMREIAGQGGQVGAAWDHPWAVDKHLHKKSNPKNTSRPANNPLIVKSQLTV